MKLIKFLLLGIVFGIVMAKSEAISWFRIQEMFRFQAFHMYGIIGTAVILGLIGVALIKKFNIKDFQGNPILFPAKDKSIIRYLAGGIIFGLGWALSGAWPNGSKYRLWVYKHDYCISICDCGYVFIWHFKG